MEVNDIDGTGHAYKIGGGSLTFLRKEQIGTHFEVVHSGSTNEEVIEVLIDRIGKLNQKLPCRENREVLICLHKAMTWLESRTRKRIEEGVENTDIPHA